MDSFSQSDEQRIDEPQSDEQRIDEPQSDFLDVNPTLSEPKVPKKGMVFKSEDEVYNFYHAYAREVGFDIKKKGLKNENGRAKYYSVMCSRGGKWKSKAKDPLKPRPSKKVSCKANINAVINDKGEFTLSRINLEHNHGLSPTKSRFFPGNKNIDKYVKRRLETNDEAGIRVSNNFHSLAVEVGGYENLNFTEKDCRNHIRKVRQSRLGVGDAASLNMYFVSMQKRNPNFFYSLDIDDDNRLRNVFWADARSIASYESFGDVISFDTTYLTNKYDMPFAPFVGVNHHGQTILFGCGLLSNEEADTYIWLFDAWLRYMSKAPNAIVTDQSRSIQKAVRTVFPDSHHRLCLWHIMKKLPDKLGLRHDYKKIKKVLKQVVYESIEVEEFEEIWANMINEFNLKDNSWLSDLYEDRHRWVPEFVRGIFWAGMSTTQRSESMNSFFDGYVNSKTSLKEFVEQYDNALKSKIEKENQADFASFHSHFPMITGFPFEKELQDAYTNQVFQWFQDELRSLAFCNLEFLSCDESISTFQIKDVLRSKDGVFRKKVTYVVYYDEVKLEVKCSCRLFEFKGIICRHIVKVFIEKNVISIPSQYILHRWRKDVKHKHSYVKNCYDDRDGECRKRYTSLYSQCSKAIEIGVESEELFQFLMRSMEETTSKLMIMSKNSSNQTREATSMMMTEDNQLNHKFVSPLKVRTKGRPTTKIKMSISEQKMNRKKKANKNKFQTQESQFGPSGSSNTYQIGTQESTV